MRVGIVVPHIFMQDKILPNVIFAPANLAISLAENLEVQGQEVTLFSPGRVTTKVKNVIADLSYFEKELKLRQDDYISLLRKHPFTFVTLARQVQSELIAKALQTANDCKLDILHFYTNEEDTALPFSRFCTKPIVFTHHDPFNFLVKYKNVFPKYKAYNWLSVSYAQRKSMPLDTNWIGNIYHGIPEKMYKPVYEPKEDYLAYIGRIITSKGVHLAIEALKKYNSSYGKRLKLKIAGKHYGDHQKDQYWQKEILPELENPMIEYVGFLKTVKEKQKFFGNAKALIMPSLFEEPFGIVMIEALACATPIIGLNSGSIAEIIKPKVNGLLIPKIMSGETRKFNAAKTIEALAEAIKYIGGVDRRKCRTDFEQRFTAKRMAAEHLNIYRRLTKE
ncbi:MAG TPA: glycosyltransferase [Candidatus Saccharimonadales bacterium]|nr:glycosyltransferase [Candidatus Saccharimonadales bacterium]